ncbi:unnamed protein product [Leuciscus chuanchicus]
MAPFKRHAYDAEFKLKTVGHAVEYGNRAAAREFNINESMVRKWRKQEDDLRQVKKTKQSFRGKKARWPQLEDKLEQWVVEQRAATTAKRLPRKAITFRRYCKKKITEKKIRPEHITNMDEVPLTFDIPVNRTVEKTGTILACQANGQKLPPMVIFKRKTLPKENFPAGVVIKANPKGWMDEEKMSEWLREIYVKRLGGFFHTAPSPLIYDSMRAHIIDAVKKQVKQTNSELAVIPGGLTKELQPLDIGVNRAFKARMRVAWEQWMTEGEHTFTKTGRQRRATYATICQWIVDAWADISVSTVIQAFTKAGIISELPGNRSDTDSDNDEREPGRLDAVVAQLFNSDTEAEEFEEFVDGE